MRSPKYLTQENKHRGDLAMQSSPRAVARGFKVGDRHMRRLLASPRLQTPRNKRLVQSQRGFYVRVDSSVDPGIWLISVAHVSRIEY
jgi:hypothetical protein